MKEGQADLVECYECRGLGEIAGSMFKWDRCATCNGTGKVPMKRKAREIAGMSIEEARSVWPEYRDWALQLFEEESPVRDLCSTCGEVLYTYPTERTAFLDAIRAGFGPMTNPKHFDCSKKEKA